MKIKLSHPDLVFRIKLAILLLEIGQRTMDKAFASLGRLYQVEVDSKMGLTRSTYLLET